MLRREVLPAPLGPMMERMRPLGISIDTSSTAVTPPNRLLTPATDSWTEAALISWDAGVKFISPPLTWRRADRHETDRRERDGADRLASKNPPRPHAATARLSLFAVIVLFARGPSGILEQAPRLRQGPSWRVPSGRWHARRSPALRLRAAPDALRRVDHQLQLLPLLLLRQGVAAGHTGKAALARQPELIDGNEPGGLVDAPQQGVLVFQGRALGGNEAKHGCLVPGQEAQWLEVAGALAVVFQQEGVDGGLVEELLRHRLVTARGHPTAAEVAAAKVQAKPHGEGRIGADPLEQRNVGVYEGRRIAALPLSLPGDLRVAQHGDGHLVELHVAAAGAGELAQLAAIDGDEIPTRRERPARPPRRRGA